MVLAHDVPGRIRLKFEKLKNNPYRLEKLKEILAVDGVYKLKTNAVTGSIVAEYDPLSVTSEKLLHLLNENGYHIDIRDSQKKQKLSDAHEKIAMNIGKAAVSFVAGRVLEANGLPHIAAFI